MDCGEFGSIGRLIGRGSARGRSLNLAATHERGDIGAGLPAWNFPHSAEFLIAPLRYVLAYFVDDRREVVLLLVGGESLICCVG